MGSFLAEGAAGLREQAGAALALKSASLGGQWWFQSVRFCDQQQTTLQGEP
ncbi:hypothetical protein CF161_23681 [Pseudomonas sp. CF161]|nr:hypothetical protein CF161_23681 [Pseudomonas sp. CF161]